MSTSSAAWPFYMELAMNSLEMGNLVEAEDACYSAVREAEARDPEGRNLATSLQALGCISSFRGRYLRAQRFYYRAWAILKDSCGESSPDAASALVQIGGACLMQHKHDEAEPLFTEALPTLESNRERENAWLIRCLHGLGDVHLFAKRRVAALVSYQKALTIQEREQGANAPAVISTLHKLGDLYLSDCRYAEAEPFYWRAHKIAVAASGPDSASAARTLQKVATMYCCQNQWGQAEALLLRAQPMLESSLGADHPEFARHLKALSLIYRDQARYKEAAALLERSIAMAEKALGPDHPDVADMLDLRADVLETCHQGKLARELRLRATAIRDKLKEEEESSTTMVM